MQKFITCVLLIISTTLWSQTDHPDNNVFNSSNNAPAGVGLGAVLGSFTTPPAGVTGTPVGLENDGSGDLLGTEITNQQYFTQTTTGALVSGPTSVIADTGNAIGITQNGSSIFITDTNNIRVNEYDMSGNFIGSFDVSSETTFPEGISYADPIGNLFVVNGSGDNIVAEYDLSGNLQTTYPVNGSSQDGIAFDSQRCVFWIYDSGTDLVRSYDSSFSEIENFPGTGAAGFGTGEGLAVVGDSLFVVATGAGEVVEFDISSAQAAANAGSLCALGPAGPATPVPANNSYAMWLLIIGLLLCGGFVARKQRQ